VVGFSVDAIYRSASRADGALCAAPPSITVSANSLATSSDAEAPIEETALVPAAAAAGGMKRKGLMVRAGSGDKGGDGVAATRAPPPFA